MDLSPLITLAKVISGLTCKSISGLNIFLETSPQCTYPPYLSFELDVGSVGLQRYGLCDLAVLTNPQGNLDQNTHRTGQCR